MNNDNRTPAKKAADDYRIHGNRDNNVANSQSSDYRNAYNNAFDKLQKEQEERKKQASKV